MNARGRGTMTWTAFGVVALAVFLVHNGCHPGKGEVTQEKMIDSKAQQLEGLLADLPKTDSWLDLNTSPEAWSALRVVNEDGELTGEVLGRLAKLVKTGDTDPDLSVLLWLAVRLEDPRAEEVILSLLASPDREVKLNALRCAVVNHLNPSPEQWLALLRDKEAGVASMAAVHAVRHGYDNEEFFLEALTSGNKQVAISALQAPGREVQEALRPIVVARLKKAQSDEELRKLWYMLSFLRQYDHVDYPGIVTLKERDAVLKCHEDLQKARDKYRANLEADEPTE